MADFYRPAECEWCGAKTWCELRGNGKRQCRACKVEKFFENVLYKPIGLRLVGWQRKVLRDLYGTLNEDGLRRYRRGYVSTAKQNGKLLDIDTLIPTPYGLIFNRDLKVGSHVLDENGAPTKITGVSELCDSERAFEVRFSSGSTVVAGESHEWLIQTHPQSAPTVGTTLDLHGSFGLRRFSIAVSESLRKTRQQWQAPGSEVSHEYIVRITEVDKRPMRCIEVDAPSHLYLAGPGMVPTHNSFLLGGLPLYHLLMEDVDGPQAYGAASAKDQAGIVFSAATQLARGNPMVADRFRILDSTRRMIRRDGSSQGVYRVIAADGYVNDGIRPSLLLIDELHRWTTKRAESLLDIAKKGMISRAEPLMLQVTTAGEEHECPLWFSEFEYARHVLDGSLASDRYYAAIWSADQARVFNEKDYWKSREARVAANPSHEDNGGFLKDEGMVEELNEAIAKPEKYHSYIRFHLNVSISKSETPAMEMPTWYSCGGGVDLREWPEYDVDLLISKWSLASRTCYVGVDLAWTTDMSALVCLFPPTQQDDLWRVLPFYWVPEGMVEELERKTRAPLSLWIKQKFLEASKRVSITAEGSPVVYANAISIEDIERKILWAREMFTVREVCIDGWGNMRAEGERLAAHHGFICSEIRQIFQNLSAPTKKLLEIYRNQQLGHGNNPILNWNAACLALQSDNKDNVQPAKPPRDTASKRIDGIAATVTAMNRAMTYAPVATPWEIEVW